MKRIILIVLSMVLISASAGASTINMEDFQCPVCGKDFTARLQGSGSTFGKMLDLKPFGAIIIPWPMPQCPHCQFVFGKDMFTDKEIERLGEYINSEEFGKLEFRDIQYYVLAHEIIFLEYDRELIADRMLQAVWESGDEKIIKEAISWFGKDLPESASYLISVYLLIELNRRIGEFENALEYCTEIKTLPEYKDYIIELAAYQEELIAAEDTAEYPLP